MSVGQFSNAKNYHNHLQNGQLQLSLLFLNILYLHYIFISKPVVAWLPTANQIWKSDFKAVYASASDLCRISVWDHSLIFTKHTFSCKTKNYNHLRYIYFVFWRNLSMFLCFLCGVLARKETQKVQAFFCHLGRCSLNCSLSECELICPYFLPSFQTLRLF